MKRDPGLGARLAAPRLPVDVSLPRQGTERREIVFPRSGFDEGQAIPSLDPPGPARAQRAVAIADAGLRCGQASARAWS